MLPPKKYTIKNQNSKSPAMPPTRKEHIPDRDSNRIINKQYPIHTPLLANYPTGYKP